MASDTAFDGTISVAGGIMTAGAVAVVDDGLEGAEPLCVAQLCVAGGLTP